MTRASLLLLACFLLAACAQEPARVITTREPQSEPPRSAPPTPMDSNPRPQPPPRGTIDVAVIDGVPLEMASHIVDVALAFQPTADVHAGQWFEVTEVSAVTGESFGGSGDYVRVVIEFMDPVPFEAWPDEAVCGIGRESNDITGIAWLLSFETEAVEAYSPQWDYEIDCIPRGS